MSPIVPFKRVIFYVIKLNFLLLTYWRGPYKETFNILKY